MMCVSNVACGAVWFQCSEWLQCCVQFQLITLCVVGMLCVIPMLYVAALLCGGAYVWIYARCVAGIVL